MYFPTVKRIAFPERGKTSSKQFNDVFDEIITDIVNINTEVTTNLNRTEEVASISADQIRYLFRRVAQLEALEEAKKTIFGKNGLRLTHHQTMYDTSNLKFFNNINLRMHVSPTFGLAHLPSNAIESKFFSTSIYNGDIILPSSVNPLVSNTFIDEDGTEPVNHEPNNTNLDEGIPKNAFNGSNNSYWVRTVEYPIDSDVTEVQCELIVTLPSQNNTYSNVLTIHPYPLGGVDIIDISTSPDLTNAWTKLQHPDSPSIYNPINLAREHKFIFEPQDIDQVRIRLRCRTFLEENGKKIFRYGLQELGLFLVDFEKTGSSLQVGEWINQSATDTITMVHEISAPDGFFITSVHNFIPNPDIQLESDINRHILFKMYDGDPTSGNGIEIWNSNQTFPQDQSSVIGAQITLAGNATKLYIQTSMRYVDQSGGINSPFRSNTSPYLKSFTLEYSVAPAF